MLVFVLAHRLDKLFSFFRGRCPDLPVSPLFAPLPYPRDEGLDAAANTLHQSQPRHAREQRPARSEQGDQNQGRTVETKRMCQTLSDEVAQCSTGNARQRDGKVVQTQRFEGCAGE